MKQKIKWAEREFDFNFPVEIYPQFIRRLKDTILILEEFISTLPAEILLLRDNDKWSIQENVGHLLTVENLLLGRLDDYERGSFELRPADLSGKRTDDVNYNKKTMGNILNDFRKQRELYLTRLEKRKPEEFEKKAFHPRLKKDMRLCDMLYFHAEHDDYHISRIKELAEKFTKNKK
jgi:hypothetical protein